MVVIGHLRVSDLMDDAVDFSASDDHESTTSTCAIDVENDLEDGEITMPVPISDVRTVAIESDVFSARNMCVSAACADTSCRWRSGGRA